MISHYRMGVLQALDAICILIALIVCDMAFISPNMNILDDYTAASTFTIFFYLLFFYILDGYSVGEEDIRESIGRVVIACGLGIIASGFTFYTFENWRFDRQTVLALFSISLLLCLGWRLFYYGLALNTVEKKRILLVGVDRAGNVRKLLAESMPQAEILGYVGEGDIDPEAGPCLGAPFAVIQVAEARNATMVVLLPDAPIDDDIARELLEAKLRGLMVVDIRSFYEHVVQRLPLSQINEEWLLLEDGFNLTTRGTLQRLKRSFDMLTAFGLMVLTAPLVVLAMLLIRMESRGPAIYSQKRVGVGEQEFTVYKLRSMRTDAEKDGAVWAQKDDNRVTRVGRFIRKVRIDELPQLWNVLKGDMSMIGPRPERMEFVRELAQQIPFYSLRHAVKPGVTGWAQVCYPYGASVEDASRKLEYDLYYVKNMSLLLDFKIILKTIGVVLFPKGSR